MVAISIDNIDWSSAPAYRAVQQNPLPPMPDVGFNQLTNLARLRRGEIADRNCLQECRRCGGCVRGA